MESLRQMAIRDGKVNPKINNVILASPDIDIDVFARQFTELGPNHPKFTVFVSQDDRALSASRLISGDVLRLGAIDPSAEPYRSKLEKAGINVFDLTKVKSGDSLNHGKFAESPEIVQLIGQRLVTGQTLTDSDVSVAQGVTAVLAGTAGTVGKVAGAAITAPIAITEMPRTAPPANKANQVDQIFQSGSQPAELTN
jgi:esterase/lipase superfamily enzyme